MELDDLVAIDGLRGIITAENPARPANAIPTLVGRFFRRGDELNTGELAAVGHCKRTFGRPLAIEQKHFCELSVPGIGQLDVTAEKFR